MAFPTTSWTLLARAGDEGKEGSRSALEAFFRDYQSPVAAFVRRRGVPAHDVEDRVQGFFLHLLEQRTLQRVEAGRGKFRSFLLGALVRYLAHERERQQAQKRGGGAQRVEIDAVANVDVAGPVDAEDQMAYDRAWATEILQRSLTAMEADYARRQRGELYRTLRNFLPGGAASPTYEEAALQLGISLGTLKAEVHRLRQRLREALRREIALTVETPAEVEEEVAYLGRVLTAQVP